MEQIIRLVVAETPEDWRHVRTLFQEYAASLDFDLDFQNFQAELATLPGDYSQPHGIVLLADVAGRLAGCVGLRPFDPPHTCEIKRLYVTPGCRGFKVGRALAQAAIDHARQLGYARILLDTVPSMREAITLYRSLGFRAVEPYRHNPIAGAAFMELPLD